MKVSQIHISRQAVRPHLSRVPIELPEPVATLARTIAANRKGRATIGARQPAPWHFPGGQPGRPVSTALFQLATEIPAAILDRTLGISTDVAVTWQRLAAGDWTTYAAEATAALIPLDPPSGSGSTGRGKSECSSGKPHARGRTPLRAVRFDDATWPVHGHS